jgi:DNA-directed RNA polymerase specialized sigma24 family protein
MKQRPNPDRPTRRHYDPDTFRSLLERAAAGDQAAATDLVEHFSAVLRRFVCRHYLPPGHLLCERMDSSDLVQDAMVAALQALRDGKEFAGEPAFVSFLCRVAHNGFLKAIRMHVTAAKRTLRRQQPLDVRRHDKPGPDLDPAGVVADAEILGAMVR